LIAGAASITEAEVAADTDAALLAAATEEISVTQFLAVEETVP
jgi:hypothetical protein